MMTGLERPILLHTQLLHGYRVLERDWRGLDDDRSREAYTSTHTALTRLGYWRGIGEAWMMTGLERPILLHTQLLHG